MSRINLLKLPINSVDTSEMKLIFEDNFASLDMDKWCHMYHDGSIRNAAYYTHDNAFIKDGKLVLRTNWQDAGKFGKGWYTGAIITSATSHETTEALSEMFKPFLNSYGYYEVRFKAPECTGIWSAFWIMPDNNFKGIDLTDGSKAAEIDVMETLYCYKFANKVTGHAVHIGGYSKDLKSKGSKLVTVKDIYTEFHTAGLLWTESGYKFYIDGRCTADMKDMNGTVSNAPSYMLLSNEVAGHKLVEGYDKDGKKCWNGNPCKTDKSKNYDFIIDYVRVWDISK